MRNKADLLDGLADAVTGQIPTSTDGVDWKASLRQTVSAARRVVLRHPWAPRVILGQSHPYAVEMALAGALGPCDDDAEFDFALEFILDGLSRLQRR